MMHKKEGWAVLIIIVIGTGLLVFAAARAVGQVLSFQNPGGNVAVDTIDWTTYSNSDFGFSFLYPPSWQASADGLQNQPPFVAIGNPLSGKSTYDMQVFIENNPSGLSAGEYVHQMLATDAAQDAANAKGGPAPRITPQFKGTAVFEIGSYEAYELSDVFEFDHEADQIYVAHGNVVLRFDFPSAEENPNISLPVANNATAREIVETLSFQ